MKSLASQHSTQDPQRAALRQTLLARRLEFLASADAVAAQAAIAAGLRQLIEQLEPQCLGLYWALEGEFNAAQWALDEGLLDQMQLALPFARKANRQMDFRRWDGLPPSEQDECRIPTATGAVVVPDVLLVPCVGFTREAYRLGYGGGYFDRWLAAHPGVTTLGLGWSVGETVLTAQPHDQALTLVLTERELIAP